VIGKLNKIKVAKVGEMMNVCLVWARVNKVISVAFVRELHR
jgi:hypothetical protein